MKNRKLSIMRRTLPIYLISTLLILSFIGSSCAAILIGGEWHFDEVSGSFYAIDSSGNEHKGIYTNGAKVGPGILGNAVGLDGVDDFINIQSFNDLQSLSPSQQISIEAWIRPSSISKTQTIIWKDLSYHVILKSDGKIEGEISSDNSNWISLSSTNTIKIGEWSHVVFTYDGSIEKIFINGIKDAEKSYSGNISSNPSTDFAIGRRHPPQYGYPGNEFVGLIDEVRIYNVAISASDIYANYRALVPQDTTPPTVSISSPSTGQTFTTSIITIKGIASDNVGLNKVEVKLGAGAWQSVSGIDPWNTQLILSSGSNTIYVKATDTSGNVAETSVIVSYISPTPAVTTPAPTPPTPQTTSSISVSPSASEVAISQTYRTPTPTSDTTPPSISISKQTVDFNKNGQLDEGEKLVITYGANDEGGVKSIKVLVDGKLIELRNNEGIYSVTTDSLSMDDQSIVVEAVDSKGNKKSEEIKINVARAGPSVYFPKSRYEVNEGEDVNVVLSAVNPIGNPKMDVLLILKPPGNGISTYESDCKGFSGQCTGKFEIEPGDSIRSVSARMRADKAGEYQVDAEIYYQFDGVQRSPTRYETLTLVVKPLIQTSIPVQQPSIPKAQGFEVIIAGIGMILALAFRRS